jgi:hypothetical protein
MSYRTSLHFDDRPAWVMVVAWTVYWICLTKWFEDPILQQRLVELSTLGLSAGSSGRLADSNSSLHTVTVRVTATQSHSLSLRAEPEVEVQQPISSVALSKMTLPQWGVTFTMCWFSMTCFFVLGAWEANLPVFGAPGAGPFEWSPFAAGNFIALGGICAFPVLVGNVSHVSVRTVPKSLMTCGFCDRFFLHPNCRTATSLPLEAPSGVSVL